MDVNTLDTCRGCGATFAQEAWQLDMRALPLVGKLYADLDTATAQVKIPLTWISCSDCGLLQVRQDVPDASIYTEYNYSSSSFRGLQGHFDRFAQIIDQELSRRPDPVFVEIGCNDGILIKRIQTPATKIGVDPSDIATKYADGSYRLINDYFSPQMIDRFAPSSVDVISTSNSFAHFSDIIGAIREIGRILKPNGLVFLEVHDGDLLLETLQWDTIYHEHKVEWTPAAVRNCFQAHGMNLVSTESLPMHGGTIRLKLAKSQNLETTSKTAAFPKDRRALDNFAQAFAQRFDHPLMAQLQELDQFCCYGASGRAVCWLYQLGLEEKIACIYDDSTERVGKFIGHSGIEIRSGNHLGEHNLPVVITAWNFADVIMQRHADKSVNWLQYYT